MNNLEKWLFTLQNDSFLNIKNFKLVDLLRFQSNLNAN